MRFQTTRTTQTGTTIQTGKPGTAPDSPHLPSPVTRRSRWTRWVRETTPEEVTAHTRRIASALAALVGLFAGLTMLAVQTTNQTITFLLTHPQAAPLTHRLIEVTSVEAVALLSSTGCALVTGLTLFGSPAFPLLCRAARRLGPGSGSGS